MTYSNGSGSIQNAYANRTDELFSGDSVNRAFSALLEQEGSNLEDLAVLVYAGLPVKVRAEDGNVILSVTSIANIDGFIINGSNYINQPNGNVGTVSENGSVKYGYLKSNIEMAVPVKADDFVDISAKVATDWDFTNDRLIISATPASIDLGITIKRIVKGFIPVLDTGILTYQPADVAVIVL